MSSFKEMLVSNFDFFKFSKTDRSKGTLLFELFVHEKPLIYGIGKIALLCAEIKGLAPIAVRTARVSTSNRALIDSMGITSTGKIQQLLISAIFNLFSIFFLMFKIKDEQDILDLRYNEYQIGNYLYDSILRALMIPTIDRMDYKIRLRIFIELVYFFFFLRLVHKENVQFIVISDCVYRYGLLFEIARRKKIDCLSPVSLNNLSVALNTCDEHYEYHYRKPDETVLQNICPLEAKEQLDEYFGKRYSAAIEQHDVMKAYSNDKRQLTREQLDEEYGLDPKKPLVMVMSHIFCDAPHSYPRTLYDDYYTWCIRTIEELVKNKHINILVKEHPSAGLYAEEGLIANKLAKMGLSDIQLKDNVHNLAILKEADIIVTCGGTVGQEFVYFGKPVVLAACPPYSEYGFTLEFKAKEDYESYLRNEVQNSKRLTDLKMARVYQVLYHDFILTDNYSDDLEIGGQRYFFGRKFDEELFYKNIIDTNKVNYNDQKIYGLLEKLINQNNKHILK